MYNRCHSLPIIFSALILSGALYAAPAPPVTSLYDKGRVLAREYADRQRRFQAAGLTIPAAPSNGGLCLIDTSGQTAPGPGQQGISGTYRLYEIQRWVVSATPMMLGQVPLTYSVNWDTAGNGERHEDNGVGTRDDWTFAIAGATVTTMTARKTANGSWLIQTAPTSFPQGVVVTQQQSISGMANRPYTTRALASAFGYPSMTIVPPPGWQPGTPIAGSEHKTWNVPQQIGWGYPEPAYARGLISCTWTLSVGP